MNSISLALPGPLAVTVGVGGMGAIFATYWDESWHTDIGRDTFWTPAHVMLYGSMAVVGLSIAAWGLRVLVRTKSLRDTLGELPVAAACLGGVAALAAAPIDNAWHEAFGRDSVEWSPPHMLVIFAATAIALGALAGIDPSARFLRSTASVLLLADAATVVFEYEADVPQFNEMLYLPILLVTGVLVAGVIKRAVPLRTPVAVAVVAYAILRLAVSAVLVLLGRSTPDLPLAVLGFAAYDLPLRGRLPRSAAAAVATSAVAWTASVVGVASQPAASVGLVAVPVIVFGLAVLVGTRLSSPWIAAAAFVVVSSSGFLAGTAERAEAHDPGQGEMISNIALTAITDKSDQVVMVATVAGRCDNVEPVALVTRRAGRTVSTALNPVGSCSFRGALRVPEPGRWFVYTEFKYSGRPAEAWLSVEPGKVSTLATSRTLYIPAGTQSSKQVEEVVAGLPIYAFGLGLVTLGILAQRRRHGQVPGVIG